MPFVKVEPYGLYPIPPVYPLAGTPANTQTIDADGEMFATGFLLKEAKEIDSFEFIVGTVSQVPANGLRVSLQGTTATDTEPSGTELAYRVVDSSDISSGAWIKTGKLTDNGTDTGNAYTPSINEQLFAVVEFETFVAGDSVQMGDMGFTGYGEAYYMEHAQADTGSGWSFISSAREWPSALKFSDGRYVQRRRVQVLNGSTTNYSFNSASTPDEHAMVLRIPNHLELRVIGAWLGHTFRPLGAADVTVYNSDSDQLATASVTVDNDISGLAGTAFFSTPIRVGPGTYRISARPTQPSQVIQLLTAPLDSQGLLDAVFGDEGNTGYHSSRTDLGTWTDETDAYITGGLIYDGFWLRKAKGWDW